MNITTQALAHLDAALAHLDALEEHVKLAVALVRVMPEAPLITVVERDIAQLKTRAALDMLKICQALRHTLGETPTE